MKKILLTSVLFMCAIFAHAQDYESYAVNVEHVDSETGLQIKPSAAAAKGRARLKYSDGSLESAMRTPYYIINEDLMGEVAGVVEVAPPAGYQASHEIRLSYGSSYPIYTLYCKPTVQVPVIPETVKFTYKVGDLHHYWDDVNLIVDKEIVAEHTGIRVGEYYWMSKNFSHIEPSRFWHATIRSGDEDLVKSPFEAEAKEDNRLTQAKLDKYLKQVLLNPNDFQVDIEDFFKDYGRYYSRYTLDYMQQWGKKYENDVENTSWGLPYIEDFRQLMGMCPFRDTKNTSLSPLDVLVGFAPSETVKLLTPRQIRGACGDVYWFGGGSGKYGFNMMPTGGRVNGHTMWATNLCKGGDDYGNVYFDAPKGDLYQLFYTVKYPALSRGRIPNGKGGFDHYTGLSLHDAVDTYNKESYHWMPIRWCRKLTDAELGYKLYITVKGINTSSKEWTDLRDHQDEIALLNAIKRGSIAATNVDIVKKGLTDAVPAGYIELPKGYMRGFYVQYNISKTNGASIANIVTYAHSVKDNAFGFQPYGASATKAAVEEVVAPASSVVTIYPNPVTETLNVESTVVVRSIKIYNVSTGALAIDLKNPTTTTINVGKLSVGLHVANIETESGVESHKFLKK